MKISDIVSSGFSLNIPYFKADSKTSIAAEKIIQKYGNGTPREHPDLDKIVANAKVAFAQGEDISAKDLRKLASACISIKDDGEFVKTLLEKLDMNGTRRHFSALFASYVMCFDKSDPLCLAVAGILSKNRNNLSKLWSKRLEKIDLLDVENIEEKIAGELLKRAKDARAFLNEIGLGGASGLAQGALICLATMIRDKALKGQIEAVHTFIDIICENDRIRAGAEIPAMIGLLAPFFDNDPKEVALKDRLQLIFIESISDPRINKSKWPEISNKLGGKEFREQCMSVLRKWLIFKAMSLFFDIIEKHAQAQFMRRRELWENYFNQGYVSDAHIIFGRDATRTAKELKQSDPAAPNLRFGELYQATADQSVLLMKISDLTIAEWSHNGKFRAWSDDAKYIPTFHKGHYYANELRKGSNPIRQKSGYHYSDGIVHNGDWVSRVERYISDKTGIRLSRRTR